MLPGGDRAKSTMQRQTALRSTTRMHLRKNAAPRCLGLLRASDLTVNPL